MDTSVDILCLGEPMAEFNETEPGIYQRGFGGDTSNCAIAAARQGASVAYLTALGTDTFGDELVALWTAEGVATTHVVRDPNAPTELYFITHDAGGHHFTYRREGSAASRMRAQQLPGEALRGCRYLHLSAISQAISADACDACFEAMAVARSAGAQISYDTNLRLNLWPLARARAVVEASLRYADIVLPSLEDAAALSGLEEPQQVLDWLLKAGPKLVALTMGVDGCWLATPEGREHIPAHIVQAVDATAAGDVFDGALLARLAAGDAPGSAARYASVAAALSTQGIGAVAPIPRAQDVHKILDLPH